MSKVDELYNKLPSSWSELSWQNYLKIMYVPLKVENEYDEIVAEYEFDVNVISILTGATDEELGDLLLRDILKLRSKLSFMQKDPLIDKTCKISWKKLEDITFDNFMVYERVKNDLINNIPVVVESFSSNNLTAEQINSMSIQDVHTGFFFLKAVAKRYIVDIQQSLSSQLRKALKKEKRQLRKK